MSISSSGPNDLLQPILKAAYHLLDVALGNVLPLVNSCSFQLTGGPGSWCTTPDPPFEVVLHILYCVQIRTQSWPL